MDKFFTWNFAFLLFLMFVVFLIHELGHYIAFRILGIKAKIRKSFLVPGIDPCETVKVSRIRGIFIAMSGFVLSIALVVLPAIVLNYNYWIALIIGSSAGAIVDVLWALSMLKSTTITIHSK